MNIDAFQKINEERAKRWHKDGRPWSLAEWTNAMAGETGEACNVAKKLLRLQTQLPNKEAGLDKSDEKLLKQQLATEIADSIIYGILILSQLEVYTSDVIGDVFDKKSMEYGFPERAPK